MAEESARDGAKQNNVIVRAPCTSAGLGLLSANKAHYPSHFGSTQANTIAHWLPGCLKRNIL